MSAVEKHKHRIDTGERKIDAALYRPAGGRTPLPGILYLHEAFGVRKYVREDARELAGEGYAVFVPDLFSEIGALRFCVREFMTKAGRENRSGGHPALDEVFVVLDYFEHLEGVDRTRVGCIGQCLTGGYVLHLARRPEMKAPVLYHHSLGTRGAGVSRKDAEKIRHTVQGHFAENDPVFCPRQRVEKLRSLLGEKLDYHEHPNVGHGLRSRFRDTPEGREAWTQTKAFFREHLLDEAA